MSKLSFISFCIEYYADHIGKTGSEVYDLFKQEKVLEFLENDYADLHGMGMEYLMQLIDDYLGGEQNDRLSRLCTGDSEFKNCFSVYPSQCGRQIRLRLFA